jgi:hypothetical protein
MQKNTAKIVVRVYHVITERKDEDVLNVVVIVYVNIKKERITALSVMGVNMEI